MLAFWCSFWILKEAYLGDLIREFWRNLERAQVMFKYEEARIGPEALAVPGLGKSRETATETNGPFHMSCHEKVL